MKLSPARLAAVAALGAVFALPAAAQQYPAKAIRVIVPQAPGSATDVVIKAEIAKFTRLAKATNISID